MTPLEVVRYWYRQNRDRDFRELRTCVTEIRRLARRFNVPALERYSIAEIRRMVRRMKMTDQTVRERRV